MPYPNGGHLFYQNPLKRHLSSWGCLEQLLPRNRQQLGESARGLWAASRLQPGSSPQPVGGHPELSPDMQGPRPPSAANGSILSAPARAPSQAASAPRVGAYPQAAQRTGAVGVLQDVPPPSFLSINHRVSSIRSNSRDCPGGSAGACEPIKVGIGTQACRAEGPGFVTWPRRTLPAYEGLRLSQLSGRMRPAGS